MGKLEGRRLWAIASFRPLKDSLKDRWLAAGFMCLIGWATWGPMKLAIISERGSKHDLRGLDALRGIAILLVIAAHFFGGLYLSTQTTIFLGNAGVIVFFFLSGFLIDRALSKDHRIGNFALKRAARILPMYWVSLLLVIAIGGRWTVDQILANATFTAPALHEPRMLGVYWTLYIEVMFYAIAPFLWRGGERLVFGSSFVMAAGFYLLWMLDKIGHGAPFYMIFCLCGMQVGFWYRGKLGFVWLAASIVTVSIASSILLPVSVYLGVISLGCAGLLIGALKLNPTFRPLEFIGLVSYSWYLLHSIFGYSFYSLAIPVYLATIAGISSTFAVSALTYYSIELSAIKTVRQSNLALRH